MTIAIALPIKYGSFSDLPHNILYRHSAAEFSCVHCIRRCRVSQDYLFNASSVRRQKIRKIQRFCDRCNAALYLDAL